MLNVNIPEPWQDYDRFCWEQEREAKKRPLCDGCEEYIMDDDSYVVGGEVYCRDCFLEEHRIKTESLMERFWA